MDASLGQGDTATWTFDQPGTYTTSAASTAGPA
jgi:hypothetical protein